jgi:CheY-like chemotaxis protein
MKAPKDTFPYPQDPRSQPLGPGFPDGGYVYVRDGNGVVWCLPDGPHLHPMVLGGGNSALYAGDLTLRTGKVMDVTNLSGTFQFDDEVGLREVAEQLRRQGLDLEAGAGDSSHWTDRPLLYLSEMATETPAMKILILEDNVDRQAAMQACLRDRFYQYEHVFFDDTKKMLAHLEADLSDSLIISLDHDLEIRSKRNGKAVDPGSGRDIANFLDDKAPTCPVIIATTNSAAGDAMEFALREAHWQTHRVHPWGDLEWITTQWFRTLRDAIVGSARPARRAAPCPSSNPS